MDKHARIEPETETHRTEKALTQLAPRASLPFARDTARVVIAGEGSTPVGQHTLTLLVHLLARMKGIVGQIDVCGLDDQTLLRGVPLIGASLKDGLIHLVTGLSGPKSDYVTRISFDDERCTPDVTVAIGDGDADIRLGADGWRVLIGSFAVESSWDEQSPLGAYLAATIGAAEVLKRLLLINVGWADGVLIEHLAFSLVDYSAGPDATPGIDIPGVDLRDVAIAGTGAGGSAALYTLASFPDLTGHLTVVEPGLLKPSSLGRYLMTTYEQVHAPIHKLDSMSRFVDVHASELALDPIEGYWHEVERDWGLVLSTVDTPEAKRDVQRSRPEAILDAGVIGGMLYGVLRVIPGGWCLECKHPYDPETMWNQRAARWGLGVDEVKRRYLTRELVTRQDIEHLADVQGRSVASLLELEGVPFDQIPSLTECGETPLSLQVPSQSPVLPLGTTAAGIVLAAEVVKQMTGVGRRLSNYFTHDLRRLPRSVDQRFRRKRQDCSICDSPSSE